jgi:hypothetical protein
MTASGNLRSETIVIDGRRYSVDIKCGDPAPPSTTRILIPAWQPNDTAQKLLDICIRSIQSNTPKDDYELWVVDNCSDPSHSEWLLNVEGINVVLSRTLPLPPERRNVLSRMAFWKSQKEWGSYANAIGLELGLRCIPEHTEKLLTLHMDTMMCHPQWLSVLKNKLTDHVRASGVCYEKVRTPEGVLHVLGMILDYQLFKQLSIDYFPAMPQIDVGDKVTLEFQKNGYGTVACRNTYEFPADAALIDPASPYADFNVMRVLNESNEVIFMHLGRGIRKSDDSYVGQSAAADEWIKFFESHVKDDRGRG